MTNHDFTKSNVGDEVTSSIHGHGVIEEINRNNLNYPVLVRFSEKTPSDKPIKERYTNYGKSLASDFLPTLFKGKISRDSFDTTYNTIK